MSCREKKDKKQSKLKVTFLSEKALLEVKSTEYVYTSHCMCLARMYCILNQLKICQAGKGNMGTDSLSWKTVLSPLAEKLFKIQQLSEKKASRLSRDKTSQLDTSYVTIYLHCFVTY
jgi:hypothetical protein